MLKSELTALCRGARANADFTVRIACAELESWFLGDLNALEKAFGLKGLAKRQSEAKFRDPDKLTNSFCLFVRTAHRALIEGALRSDS